MEALPFYGTKLQLFILGNPQRAEVLDELLLFFQVYMKIHKAHLLSQLKSLLDTLTVQYLENPVTWTEREVW